MKLDKLAQPSSRHVRIFTYGNLQPGHRLYPRDYVLSESRDYIRGKLYEFGREREPLLIDLGSGDWIPGWVLHLSSDRELQRIDREEKPEYSRKYTDTKSGERVQTYVWIRELPRDIRRISKWPSEK